MEIHVGWSAVQPVEERPYQAAVAKGIALLNEKCQGWAAKINLETLNLRSFENDPVGQVFGTSNYWRGLKQIGLSLDMSAAMTDHGMSLPGLNREKDAAWTALAEEWKRQIRELPKDEPALQPKNVCKEEWLGRVKVESTGQVTMSGVCLGWICPVADGWRTDRGVNYEQKIDAVGSLLPLDIAWREKLLATTQFVVEATAAEEHLLWEKFSVDSPYKGDRSYKWEGLSCFHVTVGEFHGFPVNISCRWAIINGLRVIFYEAISRVVDHDMITAWLKDNCFPLKSPACKAYTNADNFAHALEYSKEVESNYTKANHDRQED